MNFEYVKRVYGVPAAFGRVVMHGEDRGVVAQDMGNYVGILFDKHKPNHILPCHPTEVTYLEQFDKVRPMTRSQRRYQDFLNADCDLTFVQWLKCQSRT